MPKVSPFRALRYDEAAAGQLADLVAPPYDVIGDEEREALAARSPHNIVHLTLPPSPEAAGDALTAWQEAGVLTLDEPALWWVAQDFTGPDGVERLREGIAGAIEATPYSEGNVLPHEKTHAHAKEGRLNVLRATKAQLEPIFLIYDADVPVERPAGDPEVDVTLGTVRTRLWRLPAEDLNIDVPFLIADGHHRYETAVAYREVEPTATHTFAVLVSTRSPGLEIFPTHRIVEFVDQVPEGFMTSSYDPTSLSMYRHHQFWRLDLEGDLDTKAIEPFIPSQADLTYTPSAQQAVDAVDEEVAEVAFLVRAPTVAQVFEFANRGETMPPKSTFFYPKLTSGLLLYPL